MFKKSIAFILSTSMFFGACINAEATRRRKVLSENLEEEIASGNVSYGDIYYADGLPGPDSGIDWSGYNYNGVPIEIQDTSGKKNYEPEEINSFSDVLRDYMGWAAVLGSTYYDEKEEDIVPPELLEEVQEEAPKSRAPKGRKRRKRRQPREEVYDGYDEGPVRQVRRNYPQDEIGEYYINPREEIYDDDYIVPSHQRRRPQRDPESYEELKRRIERNYEREQQSKKRGRFRRSKKSNYDYDDYELENIQGMHRYPVEEEKERISIVEVILAVILIILIILLILYVVYLFRLSGDYAGFIEALKGLIQSPREFIGYVLN